jgi:hypothetical protein
MFGNERDKENVKIAAAQSLRAQSNHDTYTGHDFFDIKSEQLKLIHHYET